MKGEGDFRIVSFVLATIVGSKNKNINLRDLKDVDFNFTHFAYFEIEESFELIWIKSQNGPFWVLKRCSFQVKALFLPILCIIEVLDKFG